MPPENLVSADCKIACHVVPDGDTSEDDVTPDADPDFPPGSFWLSKDAEYDWFHRNAFYERNDSARGSSFSNSNSQRFSVHRKSRAAMIGLPKTQKTTYALSRRRTCKAANVRLFPKRPKPSGKSTVAVAVAEPGSPTVTCMGRVRSKRGRRRSNSSRRREKPLEKSRSGGREKQKSGFYSKVMSMFRSKKGRKKPSRPGGWKVADGEPNTVVVDLQRRSGISNVREVSVGGEVAVEPPGLGGVKRFVSGRRSDTWAG